MAGAFDRQTEITSCLSRMREALAKVTTTDLTWLAETFEQAYPAGRTLFICGNGGSAATAAHLVVDLSRTPGRPAGPRCAPSPWSTTSPR